jgi:8-amino-3,8-dideoxy-alpha-D-manno-octulosonate transaminase
MPGFEIIDYKEKKALNKLFEEGGVLFAHGFDNLRKKYHVREFEQAICKKTNVKYALAVTSGTAAIKIGLKSLGVKKNDEVITQAFNFIATIEAILDIGAKPVLVDIDNTLNMCPNSLIKSINKKTKAIIPVHMLGVPAKMDKILKISKKFKIPLLEDNCEALGARYKNKYLGTIGDVGAISFDGGKIITCGEGGIILTNNKNIEKYSREYHDHGHENNPKLPRGRDSKSIFGFNYRMTEMQGVIGKVQLKKLDKIISENKKRYNKLLVLLNKIVDLREIPKNSSPIYDTFIFFVKNKYLKKNLIKLLNKEKIGTKNLPDAIEWHCATYWDHAISKSEINKIKYTKKLLETAIAIPILLNQKISFYYNLGLKIKKLFIK